MQELVREYLNDLGKKHRKHRRFRVLSVVFALIVAGGVIWGLARAGIATTGEPRCGLEEHQHTDECYSDVLSCGLEESGGHQHTDACYQTAEPTLICELEEGEEHTHTDACYQTAEPTLRCGQEEYEGHTHTDACYTKQLSCEKEEHQHTDDCYIDKSADVEDASVWNAQYENIEWENEWGKDLVTAAKLQLDYKESAANYTVAEDGSHKGYTRYGQFDGDPYTDWDASFVNFCMYYAGLKTSQMFPDEKNTADWYDKFIKDDEGKKKVYLALPGDYEPQEGDIIFLKKENEETEFQMGIVSSYNKEDKEKNEFKVIEGNSDNQVKENTYKIDDEHIFEYIKIAEMEKAYKEPQQPAAEPEEPEQPAEDTPAPEEATIELSTEVDGVTITLYGPESSFEAGKEYTIRAEKVEDEEVLATVEEAVEQMAEEKEKKVENFQPYDIKLLLDGEEVQPLGPVAVKFAGKEVVKSVEDEKTEVNVLHVDENTGEATDMEAVATDEKEVVIETEHFSVYVYVEVTGDPLGGVSINIQHWGENIETIDSSHVETNEKIKEVAFDMKKREVVTKTESCQLYSTDKDFRLPNETYMDVAELSKVCNVDEDAGEKARYEITKVWVSKDSDAKKYSETAKTWVNGTYDEYVKEDFTDPNVLKEITNLKDGSVIRFWYEPASETMTKEPVAFYDYDISTGTQNGNVLYTEEKGINAGGNFTNNGKPKFGIGQDTSGNASLWATNKDANGKFLNKGNSNLELSGLVTGMDENGNLVFNENIDAPDCLFSDNPDDGSEGAGYHKYDNYKLEFSQNGDTYTLENVYNGTTLTNARNLTEFKERDNYNKTRKIFSNEFWPMDDAANKVDPLLGKTEYFPQKDDGTKVPSSGIGNSSNGKNDFDSVAGHNWYFGMRYNVNFKVGDYTGPLEYYFRGDDDFWLFLDGELVVDLGGIHTALSKTFDVRKDYLAKKSWSAEKEKAWLEADHTLTVYYMERGATGSCCYMQFTLPRANVVVPPSPETTSYTVTKVWQDNENGFRPQDIKLYLYKQSSVNQQPIRVREITLPLKNEEGKYVDKDGNLTDTPVWTFTWTGLPKWDGRNTSQLIDYYVEEEYIDPTNQLNPMLGYTFSKIETVDGTYATVTNTITDKKIKIRKKWLGGEDEFDNRPGEVKFRLYANGVEYKKQNGDTYDIPLSNANGWEGEYEYVPEYYYDKLEQKWKPVSYTVVEVSKLIGTNGEIVSDSGAIYGVDIKDVTTQSDMDDGYIKVFEATNKLRSKNIRIQKVSTANGRPPVSGAVFNLYEAAAFDEDGNLMEGATVKSTHKTGTDGLIDIKGLKFGEYYLMEIQAPPGHALLKKPIKLTVAKTGVTVNFQIDGWSDSSNIVLVDGTYNITVPNEVLYELPSTGGSGIYWYMFSGVLLMAAASLITYRNKRREVLRS